MQNRTRTSNSEGMLRVRGNHKYKTCGICWVLLVVMFSSASVANDPFISLFDGKTLDGWVTLDDQPITKGWEVVDGTIHVKVEKERSGYIKTTRTFENFELEFEWRIAQGGNSGVKYLAKESDSDRGRAYYGCEFQILDDKRHKNGRTPQKTAGALYDLYAPVADQKHLNPIDKFNHSKIVVDNGHIEHWLNGKKIVEATIGSKDWQAKVAKSKVSSVKDFANGPGVILLQEHLSEAWFKNIRIKPLPKTDHEQVKRSADVAPADRPNVILIYTDDHGYTDLGVHGIDKHVDTPIMDKLARGGALMTAGYSSAPQCQPSRAGLMTGRIQNEFGFPHNACDAGEGKGRMPRTYAKGTDMAGQPLLTIADRMKKLGYVTGFSGKWHLGPPNSGKPKHDPRGRGFDYYWAAQMNSGSANLTLDGKPAEHHAKRGLPKGIANRVILQGKYGESFITQNKDKPFFLYLSLFGPHIPLIEKSDPYYKNFPKLDYPHYDDWRDDRRRMGLALIKSIDDAVGGVMAKLRAHGLEENTLVLFASDNGAPTKMGRNEPGLPGGPPGTKGGVWDGSNNVPMRGEKGSLLEGGIRVPMFAYWKGRIIPGTVIEEMVTTLDLTATTLKVGGGAIPDEFDGVDLLPRLTGKAGKIDRPKPMFWEFWQTQAVRVGDWKLWRSNKQELLFNVAQDPYELTDRTQSDAEVATRLRNLLDQWSASLPRLNKAQQDASEVFAWPLSGAPKGTKPDPRYRVPYANPKPASYPAPIQGTLSK